MRVDRYTGTLTGTQTGPVITTTADEDYLATLAYPPTGSNAGHRLWTGAPTFLTADTATGLPVWVDRLAGERLIGVSGRPFPTKTQNINSRDTLTFAVSQELDGETFQLDAARNTIYCLCKPGSTAGLTFLFGPKISPTPGAPTDDVLALGWSSGVPRLVTDAGNASLLIGSGDRRGLVTLFRVTMSPERGKKIFVNGVQNAANGALTTSLTTTGFSLGSFGTSTGGRLDADIESLLILPGQDMDDPLYTAADAEITRIMKARGGI